MSKQPNYVFDDELYHHGIQGQRWGFRRFQNEDGSWTPEGRERYGEGGARSKSDVQKYKAKVSYNTQKYKADLKSKSQKERDIRTAKEERLRIKENAKTTRLARKEQGKFDRLNKKEERRLNKNSGPGKFGKTKNMSDDDLQKAIDRLKLQAEYNKQYVLATQPNSALVKADRFFEGPTGKMVRDLAVATLPKVAETATSKLLESNLKYANKEDRDKVAAETESFRAKADQQRAEAESKRSAAENASNESKLNMRIKEEENFRARGLHQQQIRLKEEEARQNARIREAESQHKMKIERSNQKAAVAKTYHDIQMDRLKQLGGHKYVDNRGVVRTTTGTLAEDDEQKRLETIAKRKKLGLW